MVSFEKMAPTPPNPSRLAKIAAFLARPGVNITNIFGTRAKQLLRRYFVKLSMAHHLAKMHQNMALCAKAVA
jgi:hypothetical protein